MDSGFGEIREIVEALDLMIEIEVDLDPKFEELKRTSVRLQKADPLKLAKTIASFGIVGSIAGVSADELKAAKDAYINQWKEAVMPSPSKNAASSTTP